MANGSWPGNSVMLDATSPAAAVIGIRTRTPSLKCPTARLAGPAGVQAAPSATGSQRRVAFGWHEHRVEEVAQGGGDQVSAGGGRSWRSPCHVVRESSPI